MVCVEAGAPGGGQTLPQAAFQLIDNIGLGNRLQLANVSLESEPELRVGCAQHEAELPGWKDERCQLLIEPDGGAKE